MQILIAVAALGGIGLVLGLLLAAASKYLSVEKDEKAPLIESVLPGANCGGCGYAGCAALAEAIARGEAPVDACPVGGNETSREIAEIMGVAAPDVLENVATVVCSGDHSSVAKKYEYDSDVDCKTASTLAGGDKKCRHGCLGLGDCMDVCAFGAISVKNGVANIDPEKCTACTACIDACPKGIIRLVPKKKSYIVRCSSQSPGPDMKGICTVGCIACRICEKECPEGAIQISDNLAKIDYSKCTDCGECFQKCPKKIIKKK
ncbi:MAG: Electron transport complex protein rnfB [Firmicutes bacterium ADurb.Bin193]|nr:MAG: Electron transport complex protein rnfB [Firmicutes bacterium ADurb.Bin193]